jgi:hypothetical protein
MSLHLYSLSQNNIDSAGAGSIADALRVNKTINTME